MTQRIRKPPLKVRKGDITIVDHVKMVRSKCKTCEEEFLYPFTRLRGQYDGAITKRTRCDKCRHDPFRRARIEEFGLKYKDAPPHSPIDDLRTVETHARRALSQYRQGFVVVKPQPDMSTLAWEQAWPMADKECEHGRLPGDPCTGKAVLWPHTEPCECWSGS